MESKEKIESTIWEAGVALKHLEFAIRLEAYCNQDPKTDSFDHFLEEFNIPHVLELPEGRIDYNNQFSEKEIIMHSGIGISNALAISAQVLNRLYEEADIKICIPPKDIYCSARLYVNIIRNLFQHTTGAPVWEIIPKKQEEIKLRINDKTTIIDFRELQGKQFEYSQIGGLVLWLEVADFAISHVKELITM